MLNHGLLGSKLNYSRGGLEFEQDAVIYWPGGGTRPPLGRPVCGWDNELCIEGNECMFLSCLIMILSFKNDESKFQRGKSSVCV